MEQLCINFANEKLQNIFNRSVVEDEVNTCKEEGVKLPAIDFNVNSGVVSLLEEKGEGMLLMLDEELRVVGGTDDGWMRKVLKIHQTGEDTDIISDRPPRHSRKKGNNANCFWRKKE